MAEQVFPLALRRGPWTAREVQELKKYVGATTEDVIARVLGRTPEEVKRQVTELGRIQESGRWNQAEVADLKRIYGTRTNEDLSIILGRSVESIERQAQRLCLAKDKAFLRKLAGAASTRMPRWSAEEIALLEKLYPEHSNLEIAQALDRSVKSVVSKAHNLDLKKNRSRLEEMGRENVSLRYRKEDEEPIPEAPRRDEPKKEERARREES